MIGIYCIQNKINKKTYVGQSVDIQKRWKYHISHLNNNSHDNLYLQKAWNKYGKDNFSFRVLEICSQSELNEKETMWCNKFRPLVYNLGATGRQHTMSESTKEKMRLANLGNKNGFYGKTHTKQTKELLAKLKKGTHLSYETRQKISEKNKGKIGYWRGKKRSDEDIKKAIRFKKVNQYDLDHNFIKLWNSIKEASLTLNINLNSIIRVCKGTRHKAGNYYWEYADK